MEVNRINGVFRLGKEDYPERKRTNIIITDDGDNVCVGVTAVANVYELDEDGNITIHPEQWGDLKKISKDAPVGCIFDSLKELFETVPEIIDRRNKSDEA